MKARRPEQARELEELSNIGKAIGKYGFISLVRDPDGNMIGLHSMR